MGAAEARENDGGPLWSLQSDLVAAAAGARDGEAARAARDGEAAAGARDGEAAAAARDGEAAAGARDGEAAAGARDGEAAAIITRRPLLDARARVEAPSPSAGELWAWRAE
ncbi:hypothetical protein [Geodermatophilus telluris]|uniref:hypothetical protein n=1 Tax=Geodermatophilus telluris TaxID=1190417 RepID=UPI000B85C209|nr:hypothetical protein [Geodermatophilus telluris]